MFDPKAILILSLSAWWDYLPVGSSRPESSNACLDSDDASNLGRLGRKAVGMAIAGAADARSLCQKSLSN
jgi:hypothetical protein